MGIEAMLALGLRAATTGLALAQAAQAGDEDAANKALDDMRNMWQEGSDALDNALAERDASRDGKL